MGTEAIFAVLIKVVCGGAPEEAVIAALVRAAVVLLTHEGERKLTELALCIAEFHLHHCSEIRIRSTLDFRYLNIKSVLHWWGFKDKQ